MDPHFGGSLSEGVAARDTAMSNVETLVGGVDDQLHKPQMQIGEKLGDTGEDCAHEEGCVGDEGQCQTREGS